MKILDLYAGAGGERRRSKIEARGHSYVTLDLNPKFKCNLTMDMMTANLRNSSRNMVILI